MTESAISDKLHKLKAQLRDFEHRYQRPPESVRLIAVSKTRSAEEIRIAARCQQREFGESYVQEAINKISLLQDLDLIWHFIGPVQKNKTKAIAQHFSWVHSIDRPVIATRLHEQRPENMTPLNVCVQINIDKENSKAGVSTDQLLSLAKHVNSLNRLRLRGLMAIPVPQKTFHQQLETFQRMQHQFTELQHHGFPVDTLSMGMSNDYEAAIAAGATMVRIGTAIFGSRAAK